MSKYTILGILLAVGTSLFCMRLIQPNWFFAIFGGGPTATVNTSYKLPPSTPSAPFKVNTPVKSNGEKIQLALILDTSNSMDGLLEQAKSQLWKLVNEMASLTKNGQTPDIEIALYQYGNDELSIRKGYVEQISKFTTDFDLISEKLFSLSTMGGSEYSGQAIKYSLTDLRWTNNPNDLKLVFIAGNEPFNQGPISYQTACAAAVQHNILINTIHCGDYNEGIKDYWKDGAIKGGGEYMNIDHNDEVVHIATPYDDDIVKLNDQLNETYVHYGTRGKERAEGMIQQDQNAMTYSKANMRSRAMVKSKSVYKNSSWDLVDLSEDDPSLIEDVEIEELPDVMQSMDASEKAAFLKKKKEEREVIQKQLREYERKVKEYIQKEKIKNASKQTLDNIMLNVLRKQAKQKDFTNS